MVSEDLVKNKWNSNEIIVNLKSNFKSQLVRGQSILDDTRNKSLILKGMGKATSRAVNLATQLNANNYNSFTLISSTYSVKLDNRPPPILGEDKDSFDPTEARAPLPVKYKPAIQIIVQKSSFEIEKFYIEQTSSKQE